MEDEVLGEEFAGVLFSDFYAAYHHYDGPKQSANGGLGSPLFKSGAGSAEGHPRPPWPLPRGWLSDPAG